MPHRRAGREAAVLANVLGPIMLYARSQLLGAGEFRDRAQTALASPDVQDYVADALTANLVARGGAEAERAEPLVRAVGGVVASDRFEELFGPAVGALHDRLLDGRTAKRMIELQDAADQAEGAIALISPERLRLAGVGCRPSGSVSSRRGDARRGPR